MKIYFAAHGTTNDNANGIASGWSDAELSELGIKQAKEYADIFKDIEIDLICCSDLQRAVDTVKFAFGDRLPVVIDQRLRELNYGDYNGGSAKVVGGMAFGWRVPKRAPAIRPTAPPKSRKACVGLAARG